MNACLHTKMFPKYEELLLLLQAKPCESNLRSIYAFSFVEKGFELITLIHGEEGKKRDYKMHVFYN